MKPINQWKTADIIEFVKSVDKKTWIMLGSWAVAFLLAFVFFIAPAWIERPLLRRDIEGMEGQIRTVNMLSQKRPLLEENQKVFGDLIDQTRERLFTANDLGMLLGQISKKGSVSRVAVLASKPVAEKSFFPPPYDARYQPRGYEFTLQGGYHDLGGLVSLIESHEKLLRVRAFQIVPSKESPERHIAELKLWAILEAPQAGAANA